MTETLNTASASLSGSGSTHFLVNPGGATFSFQDLTIFTTLPQGSITPALSCYAVNYKSTLIDFGTRGPLLEEFFSYGLKYYIHHENAATKRATFGPIRSTTATPDQTICLPTSLTGTSSQNGGSQSGSSRGSDPQGSTFTFVPSQDGYNYNDIFQCESGQGSNITSCKRVGKGDAPDSTGLKAAAGVLGGVLFLALAFFLFLFIRTRRSRGPRADAPYGTIAVNEGSGAASDSRDLEHKGHRAVDLEGQLATVQGDRVRELEGQLAIVQGSLLAQNSRRGGTLDDRAIASKFDGLGQEIKDWVFAHLQTDAQTTGAYPGVDAALLQHPKTRAVTLRAIVSNQLVQAMQNGEFVCEGALAKVARKMENSLDMAAFSRWRSETYAALAAEDVNAVIDAGAVATAASRIDITLASYSAGSTGDRLSALTRIVQSAAQLSVLLGRQQAQFKIIDKREAGETFNNKLMDDVWQESETVVGKNPLDGRAVKAVVVPGVLKWGNELGERYDQVTVVAKAKVLV